MPKIAIITATTGRPELRVCAECVARQSYRDLEHVIVVDGREHSSAVRKQLRGITPRPIVVELPEPTGLNNFNGHRIYGSLPYLVDATWVAFLDDDNWFEDTHCESLIRLVETNGLQWAYALRKIVTWNGRFICNDDCNSLGWWPSFDGGYNHVDTNCYLLNRQIAVKLSSIWNRRSGLPQVETADRALCMRLLRDFPLAFTTGKYSVNYRIGSRSEAAKARAFYECGNQIMTSIYRKFPWNNTRLVGRLAEHPCLAWEILGKNQSMQKTYVEMWNVLSPLQKRASEVDL